MERIRQFAHSKFLQSIFLTDVRTFPSLFSELIFRAYLPRLPSEIGFNISDKMSRKHPVPHSPGPDFLVARPQNQIPRRTASGTQYILITRPAVSGTVTPDNPEGLLPVNRGESNNSPGHGNRCFSGVFVYAIVGPR